MRNRITVLLASSVVACSLVASRTAPAMAHPGGHSNGSNEGPPARSMRHSANRGMSAKQIALSNAMRKLWEDHITWTRLFIVSAAHDLPNTQATTERLLRNQVDIGNAINPFYGEAAGDQLTALLTEHILIAAEIITAAKANDTAGVNDAVARWYTNADQIADFLSSANPKNWPQA